MLAKKKGRTEITPNGRLGGIIDAILDDEAVNLRQLRYGAHTFTNTITFSNTVTFSNSLLVDVISEKTAGSGITVDGLLIKDNALTGWREAITPSPAATNQLVSADSGKTFLMDRASGASYTLPVEAVLGTKFRFVVSVSVTSNNHVIEGGPSDLFIGSLIMNDTDSSGAVVALSPDNNDKTITMNGSTKGGLIGTEIELTCVRTAPPALYQVKGVNRYSGDVVTPFS